MSSSSRSSNVLFAREVRKWAVVLAVAIVGMGCLAPAAPAASLTWDTLPGVVGVGDGTITGNAGHWNTTNGNWTIDGGANNIAWNNANNDTAVFTAPADQVTLDEPITAGGLVFSGEDGWQIFGNTLTLGGAAPTITANFAATINSALAGTAGFTLSGTGALTLGGVNTALSGSINVSGTGPLQFAADNNLGSTGTIALGNGATLKYTGATAYSPGASRVFSVAGSNAATFDTNGQTLTLGTAGQVAGGGTLVRSGASTTGDTILGDLGAVAAGTTLQIKSGRVWATAGAGTITGNFALSSGSLYAGSQAYTYAGNLTIGTGSNALVLSDTGTNGHAMTLGGIVGGTGNVSVSTNAGSAQTLTLTNTGNNMSGTWTLGGNVTLTAQAAGGTGNVLGTSSTIVLNTTSSLLNLYDQGDNTGSVQNLGSGGAVTVAANTAITVNRAGTIALNKNLRMGGLSIGANTLTATNNNGYGLEFTGAATLTGAPTFNVATASASNVVQGLTLSGVISGSYGLTKSGNGTLVLGNSANSFGISGSTLEVTGGVLQVAADGALGDAANVVKLSSATQALRAAGTFATGRTINLNANTGIDVTAGNTLTLNAAFTGAAGSAFTKADNGILALGSTVDNTALTGGWTISAGALQISNSSNLNAGGSALTVSNAVGSALQLTNNITLNRGGAFTINGSGINSAGALENSSGTNTVASLITLGSAATIGADANSTLNITGGIGSSALALTLNAASGANININTSAINAAVTPINKIGVGTVTLGVASGSVVAPLNINAGTFAITDPGILGATGLISVAPAAALVVSDTGTATPNRLGGRPLTLNGGIFTYTGNASAGSNETTGALTVLGGQSVVTVTAGTGQQANLNFNAAPVRNATQGGTVLFRGSNLGYAAGAGTATIKDGTTGFTFIGQSGAANATNKGILPWALVDSSVSGLGTSFATADTATSILRPLNTGNEMVTNTLTGSNNVLLTSSAALASSVSINSLTITTTGSLTMTTPAFPTALPVLTVLSGGLLSTAATSTIAGGVLAPSGQFDVFTPGANAAATVLTISSPVISATGFAKAGAGTLVLSSASAAYPGYSGNTMTGNNNNPTNYVNEGVVRLGASDALMYGHYAFSVYPGATLDLNGNMSYIGGLSSQNVTNAANYVPGIVTASGVADDASAGLVKSSNGNGSLYMTVQNSGASNQIAFSGSIQGANVGVARAGEGTGDALIFRGVSTYGGPTLFCGGAVTVGGGNILKDDGRFTNTSRIDINYAALTINNTGLSDNPDRVNDAAPMYFRGGSLWFLGRAQAASTETLGAVTAVQGQSTITVTPGGTGVNSADLTLSGGSISRTVGSGATLNFVPGSGTFGLVGSNPRINVNGATAATVISGGLVNNIIPWATVSNADFASYIPYTTANGASVGGIGALGTAGYPAYDGTALPGSDQPTQNIKVSSPVISASIKLNSLNMNNSGMTFTAGTEVLNLTSGGLLAGQGGGAIGASVDSGRITAGGTAQSGTSDLYFYMNNNNRTLNSRIIDTSDALTGVGGTGRTRLVFAGNNTITMSNTANSYTGGTVLDGVSLALSATSGVVIPNAANPADGLVINNTTVTLSKSAGQIGSGNIATLNGAARLNLFGNNSLLGLVINNNGMNGGGGQTAKVYTWNAATNTANTVGTLTLGASGITTSSNVIPVDQLNPTIYGRLSLAADSPLSIGPSAFNGQAINPTLPDLTLTGVSGGGGTITKSGGGVLAFSSPTVLSGTLDVTAGGVQLGPITGPTGTPLTPMLGARLADLKLEAGAWLNLNGNSGLFGSLAGPGEVTNTSTTIANLTVGFDNTNTTFSGTLQRFNDATVWLVNLIKIGSGTMTMTGTGSTASGQMTLNSTGGGGVTIKDAGVNPFVSAVATVNQGSTLTLDNTGVANVNNRLAPGGLNVPLTLNGGAFGYIGRDSTLSSESNGTSALTFGPGESTLTSTPGAGGTNTLSFGSLSQLAAGTFTFAGTGLGTAANKIAFTTTVPGNGTIFYRGAVGNDFAMYDTTLGIKAFTAYVTGTNINTAVNYADFKVDATTAVRNLTATAARSLYSLTIADNGATIGTSGELLPTQGLTISSVPSAFLVNCNSATISTPVLAQGGEGIFRVNGTSFTVASAITGASGLTKTGTGDMTISKAAAYSGTTTVNQGKLVLAGGKNTLLAYQSGSTVNSAPTVTTLNMNGGTLDLNGNSQLVGPISSVNPYASSVITNASGTPATLTTYVGTTSTTFGGQITGNLNFALAAGGNTAKNAGTVFQLTFKDAQSYTGDTIIRNTALRLQDKGALVSSTNILTYFGGLVFDNSALNPANDLSPTRVPAGATITLNAGWIQYMYGDSVDNVFNLGTVKVDRSINFINAGYINVNGQTVSPTGPDMADKDGASATMTIDNLQNTSNGGLVGFKIALGDAQAKRLIINKVNGTAVTAGAMLPPWILANGLTDFAVVNPNGFGVVNYGNSAAGTPAYVNTFASGNVTSVGATSLSATSTTTKALKLTGALTFSSSGNSLNVESGGLITAGQNIGDSTNAGVLTAGGAATSGTTDLYLINTTATNTATVSSVIKDTYQVTGAGSAKVRLIVGATDVYDSAILLNNKNTYSGGTVILGGKIANANTCPVTLGTNAFIPAGGLTIYAPYGGGSNYQIALTTTNTNQIDPSNDVTIMMSGAGLTMMAGTTNTLSSLIFNNWGGAGNSANSPLVNTASQLILTGTGPQATASGYVIDSTNDQYYSIPNIQGTLLTVPDGATINTAGEAPISLIIGAQLSLSGSTLPLHKTGPGSMVLSFANTFANGVNLDQGSIIFNANTTPTTGTVTSGPLGTGVLKLANNTAIMSDGTARTIANLVTVGSNATFTFGTLDAASVRANAGNNLTLSNTVTLSGNNTINVNGLLMVGTISGKLTGGTSLTKGGPGTLVLSNAANDYAGATTVNAGVLQSGATNALPVATDLTVSSGAAFDLYNNNQAVNSLSGAGLVINSQNAVKTLTIGGTTPNAVFSGVLTASTPANLVVTKTGANTQVLSGLCTYTGSTTITQGTLQFGKEVSLYNNGAAAAWLDTNIVVNGGATLALNVGGSGEFTAGDIDTLKALGTATGGFTNGAILGLDTTNASGGAFTYSGTIANTNANANVLGLTKLGTGTLALTALSTYSGNTRVQAGVLEFNSINNLGVASALGAPTDAASGQIDLATPASAATLRLVGSTSYGTNRVVNLLGNGTIDASSSASEGLALTGTAAASVTDSASYNLTLTGSGYGEIDKAVNLNGGGLTKSGGGTWLLAGSNSYTGGTTVNNGTLNIATADSLPTGGNLAISSGGHVVLQSGLSHAISLGGLTITSGAGGGVGQASPLVQNPGQAGSLTYGSAASAPTPEPGTLALLAAGALAGLAVRRRRTTMRDAG